MNGPKGMCFLIPAAAVGGLQVEMRCCSDSVMSQSWAFKVKGNTEWNSCRAGVLPSSAIHDWLDVKSNISGGLFLLGKLSLVPSRLADSIYC